MSEEAMASGIEYRMPAPLDVNESNYEQWKRFHVNFKIFLTAAGLNRTAENRKAAVFLNCIGPCGQELYYNTLINDEDVDKEYKLDEVIELFENHFKPKTNEVISTFLFNKRLQQDGEGFDQFYTEIRKIARSCNFNIFKDRMLRDRIIHGINNKKVQQKLLEKKELSLDQAVEICRASELSNNHAKTINQQQTSSPEVDAVKKVQGAQANTKAKYTYLCKKCNRTHGPRNCPAFGKNCSICQKMNHFAVGCRAKNKVDSLIADDEQVNNEYKNENPVDL